MSNSPRAWSLRIHLKTAPTPALYDVRGRLLNELRGLADVERFRIRDEDISVIYDGPCELHVGVEYISYTSYLTADIEGPMEPAMAVVARLLDPNVTSLVISFQHLSEVVDPPPRAAQVSSQRLLGSLAERTGIFDYAALVDGQDPTTGRAYQAEFGVISAEEAPFRLTRFAGRMQAGEPSNVVETLMAMEFPETAIFVDSRWTLSQGITLHSPFELQSLVREIEQAADRLAASVTDVVVPSKVKQG
ncbi:MAG: hypothetical protein JWO76_310 [Nocardioides sp.]|nr:hypothetical protein [Nocardioides sp.]